MCSLTVPYLSHAAHLWTPVELQTEILPYLAVVNAPLRNPGLWLSQLSHTLTCVGHVWDMYYMHMYYVRYTCYMCITCICTMCSTHVTCAMHVWWYNMCYKLLPVNNYCSYSLHIVRNSLLKPFIDNEP